VHTKRNLKALEDQQISLARREAALAEQAGNRPQFEHTLLLGHVSMLTAICVGTVTTTATEVEGGGVKTKEYIITADRDEHIRVSRGMPQAHVIEGFCLGHEDFVSRLCVAPGGKEGVLISGGGDDYLLVWDWLHGKLLGRAGVLEHVRGVAGQEEAGKVAVTRVFACRWEEGRVAVFVVVERYVSSTPP
jgi:tRNA (guanine-N(7)-)-methyltransferase subunit TRM82